MLGIARAQARKESGTLIHLPRSTVGRTGRAFWGDEKIHLPIYRGAVKAEFAFFLGKVAADFFVFFLRKYCDRKYRRRFLFHSSDSLAGTAGSVDQHNGGSHGGWKLETVEEGTRLKVYRVMPLDAKATR